VFMYEEVVIDSAGQKLAYVYFEDEPGRRSAAKLLSKRMRRDVSRRKMVSAKSVQRGTRCLTATKAVTFED
jgi:hypothetical protein